MAGDLPRALRRAREHRAGQATARAVVQVLRLALAYALLDSASAVDVPHLVAAHALWNYAESSAMWVFGNAGQLADRAQAAKLLEFVKDQGAAGVSREEIRSRLYQRHKRAGEITALLRPLIESGNVEQRTEQTPGRSRQVFHRARYAQ